MRTNTWFESLHIKLSKDFKLVNEIIITLGLFFKIINHFKFNLKLIC